ncbi:hypothetical protein LJR231_002163 [Phyllobacterium sp. LjRoot231]|uniref:hypothetical protein n=1 Tax=Phyllobacterium sp. LjRoot231 TaxID=3342289 RepID=UPI003ECC7E88
MAHNEQITLTIHGLDQNKRDVDGEVFAKKLTALMAGLAAADIATNGKRKHKFFITELKKNTATASFREQVTADGQTQSGIVYFRDGLRAIREGAPEAKILPKKVVELLRG